MRTFLDDADVLKDTLIDPNTGQPYDLTSATVVLDLIGPSPISATANVPSPRTAGNVEVAFTPGFFPRSGDYTGRWHITFFSGRVTSVPGVVVRVYDPTADSRLYANLLDLEGYVGEVTDTKLAMLKLEAATEAVKGYAIGPISTNPVPERVRQTTAILAARLYAAPAPGGDSGRIASETIGDYRIAYQNDAAAAGLMIVGDPVLANLMAPWHPRIVNAFIGPDECAPPLPVTYAEADLIALEGGTTTEVEMILDLNPATLDIAGVRAGDRNERSFALTSGGSAMDLTDAVLSAQARKFHADTAPSLTAEITMLDAEAGSFSLAWPGDQVATLLGTASYWSGVWDLQVVFPGELPITVLQGTITCTSDVTR